MSCKVNVSTLDDETLKSLKSKALLKIESSSFFSKNGKGQQEFVKLTRLIPETNDVFIPFAMARKYNLPIPDRKKFPPFPEIQFNGVLRENQNDVKREAIDLLEKHHSVIISCYTGFGKTIGSINLALKLKLKTLIVVTRVVLMDQWKESIIRFCSKKNEDDGTPLVEIITSSSKDDYVMCNFAIINAVNISKMEPGFLESFGTVIVDEVHLVMAKKTFRNLLHVTPRYLIALSATSYRSDGLDALFPIFFGNGKIKRDLKREHTIYKVTTSFKPEVKFDINGKMNWNALLEEQASNEERNRLIIKIVNENPERTFLILVKRIKQGEWLAKELKQSFLEREMGQLTLNNEKSGGVETLFGSNQKFDKSCRVLIGTSSKIGTGFDFDKLDTLLLAADVVEYYIQFLGRIMRREDVHPIIFDFVDRNKTLLKHYSERLKVYKKHGGIIKDWTSKS
ncbi:putative helicase [Armadillidium vulgare iridescent virus]|uniref:Putative helicase n=1 Tax=Armadillidium vulgare iridescent virus TaxID=72201 RepID=A0A068QK77_9VIRU|nr:putative helicase [Armadillidium vulgare iridescent virus]CCV02427.1 putative helicase [Armadillidium vulgare iridescent virus]